MFSGERYTKYTLQSSLCPQGITRMGFEVLFLSDWVLFVRGPIYCTSIRHESRLHTKHLMNPHSGQTTITVYQKGLRTRRWLKHRRTASEFPAERVFLVYCAIPMLSNVGEKKCCRRVRLISAANALTAHVSNAQLKLRVTPTLLGAPLSFLGAVYVRVIGPPPEHYVGRRYGASSAP